MKKKSLIWRLLPWVLLAVLIGGIVYVGYLLWGKPEAEPLYTAEIYRYEEEKPKNWLAFELSLYYVNHFL